MSKNNNYNGKLLVSMQLINVFIGIVIALMCVVAYITIDNMNIRLILIFAAIIIGIVCFVNLYNKLNNEEILEDKSHISTIELVNEENEIIKIWDVSEKVSFVIGKSTVENKVLVDLNFSTYSNLIENNHAVLNYASGRWYIEDVSTNSGVTIQKRNDSAKYRIVKDTPCELEKEDILFISKIKLLLK